MDEAPSSRYMLWQTLDAFVWICAAYLKAPVLSVESETCLDLSEKGGGLKKGEISKGEKWLSPCMYVLHCCHSYLLMASRHRTWAGYLARFVSSTSSDASATLWLIGPVIDNIFLDGKHLPWQNTEFFWNILTWKFPKGEKTRKVHQVEKGCEISHFTFNLICEFSYHSFKVTLPVLISKCTLRVIIIHH